MPTRQQRRRHRRRAPLPWQGNRRRCHRAGRRHDVHHTRRRPHRRRRSKRNQPRWCRPRRSNSHPLSAVLTSARGRPVVRAAHQPAQHVFIRPHCQPRRDRGAHRAYRQASRAAHDCGLLGRGCAGPAHAGVRRSAPDRTRGGSGKLPVGRGDPQRGAAGAGRSASIRATVSWRRTRSSPRIARAPASCSSVRRPKRSAPWASRTAPRR